MVYTRTNLLCWNCSLNQVDIKVFPAFLRYVPYQSDALRRQIINMIVNRLYEASEKGDWDPYVTQPNHMPNFGPCFVGIIDMHRRTRRSTSKPWKVRVEYVQMRCTCIRLTSQLHVC